MWAALTEETRASGNSLLPENLSLKEVMDTWTRQDGYPVVTVTRDYEKGSAELSQVCGENNFSSKRDKELLCNT